MLFQMFLTAQNNVCALSDTFRSSWAHDLQQVSRGPVTQARPSKDSCYHLILLNLLKQTLSLHTHRHYQCSSKTLLSWIILWGIKKSRALLLPETDCFKCSLCHSSGLVNLCSLEVESHVLQPEDGAVGTAQHQTVEVICWLGLPTRVHQSCLCFAKLLLLLLLLQLLLLLCLFL